MYKYEEMDFNEILADPEIDPDNAEVMYAIAQCYRQGKGVEADAQKYAEMLQNAADAGSEAAAEELKALTQQEKIDSDSNEEKVQRDLTTLPIDELMDLAEADDIRVCCEVYRRYGKEESRYLMHAAELIDQGNHSLNKEECQKILETLAAYYLNRVRDIAKGMEAYGKAVELGSAAACWKLVELCADEQQKMFYAKKASEVGNDYDIYRYAEILRKSGRHAEADACLAKLLKNADLDETLKVQIKMHHHTEAEEKEVVQLAWSHVEEPSCKKFLENYYGTDPAKLSEDKLPIEEQAYKLADLHRGSRWNGNPWYAWMQWAAERGNEKAIAEVQAEIRRECEEEQKNQKKYPKICLTGEEAVDFSIADANNTFGSKDSNGVQLDGVRYGNVVISAVMEVDAFYKLGFKDEDIDDWNEAIKWNFWYPEETKGYLFAKFDEDREHIRFPIVTYGYNNYYLPLLKAESFECEDTNVIDNNVREYIQMLYKNEREDVYHAMLITDHSFSPFADSRDARKFFADHLKEVIMFGEQLYCDQIGVVAEIGDYLTQNLHDIGFKKLSPTCSVYSALMSDEGDDARKENTVPGKRNLRDRFGAMFSRKSE